MPLGIGNDELSLVATRDLGGLGPAETEPVTIEWRWYYHLFGRTVWILVALLLVVVKENRRLEAWAILIPALVLNMLVWPWLARSAGVLVHFRLGWRSDEHGLCHARGRLDRDCALGRGLRGVRPSSGSHSPWCFCWRLGSQTI